MSGQKAPSILSTGVLYYSFDNKTLQYFDVIKQCGVLVEWKEEPSILVVLSGSQVGPSPISSGLGERRGIP